MVIKWSPGDGYTMWLHWMLISLAMRKCWPSSAASSRITVHLCLSGEIKDRIECSCTAYTQFTKIMRKRNIKNIEMVIKVVSFDLVYVIEKIY